MEIYLTAFWIVLAVVLVIIEAMTPQMITIWFAVGAFSALISSLFKIHWAFQATIFVTVSVIALILTRPLVKKYINQNKIPTNSDRVIGKTGIVKETIDNTNAVGIVSVDGNLWTARSADGSVIEAGTKVTAERIEGVKLIVSVK